jgi:hypothetical protein
MSGPLMSEAAPLVVASISAEVVLLEEEALSVCLLLLHSHCLCFRLQMFNKEIRRKELILHRVLMAQFGKKKKIIPVTFKTAHLLLSATAF